MRPAALLGLALVIVVVVSLTLGDYHVSLLRIVQILWQPESDPVARRIVMDVRLPRVTLALIVGAALGLAGVLTQSILRNPLAEPGLLGMNSGAALVVTGLVVLLPQAHQIVHAVGAFTGAMLAAAIVYGFSIVIQASMARLVLVGVGIGAMTGGLAAGISLWADSETAQRLMVWLTGSVYDSTWPKIVAIAPWLALPASLAWLLSRDLDVLVTGDDIARGLGLRLEATTAVALILSALLSAICVTLAGPIAFVGLIAPHIARRLGARNHFARMPMAALVGALIVSSADLCCHPCSCRWDW